MKLAIMQPYFFPYIGYWQLISSVDNFVIYDDVNYIKKGYINRNSILGNNGEQPITLELNKASQNKKINEIEVGNNKKKLLKTLYFSYKKAPYFKKIYPLIESIFHKNENNLAKFLGFSLKEMSSYLDIKCNFIYSSDIDKNNLLTGEERILEICKTLQATQYINTIGGKTLYKKESFLKNNLEIFFLESQPILYVQFQTPFLPNLSILDILMFNSKPMVLKYLKNYSFQ